MLLNSYKVPVVIKIDKTDGYLFFSQLYCIHQIQNICQQDFLINEIVSMVINYWGADECFIADNSRLNSLKYN